MKDKPLWIKRDSDSRFHKADHYEDVTKRPRKHVAPKRFLPAPILSVAAFQNLAPANKLVA